MSIGVQCTGCGRRYRVADTRAGTTMACECGQSFPVEGTHYIDKICASCGIDVSSLTRTRDPQGNYYCQPCWDELVHAHRAAQQANSNPEIRWFTRQLSRLRLKRLLRPLIVLVILACLVLGWFVPKTGQVLGAGLVVLGGALLVICTVWLFVIPFRDGAGVGLSCMLSSKRRRRWADQNPDFNLRRPASLALIGLTLVLLAALFFALWIASRQYWGLA